jgi:hypothetical protein
LGAARLRVAQARSLAKQLAAFQLMASQHLNGPAIHLSLRLTCAIVAHAGSITNDEAFPTEVSRVVDAIKSFVEPGLGKQDRRRLREVVDDIFGDDVANRQRPTATADAASTSGAAAAAAAADVGADGDATSVPSYTRVQFALDVDSEEEASLRLLIDTEMSELGMCSSPCSSDMVLAVVRAGDSSTRQTLTLFHGSLV